MGRTEGDGEGLDRCRCGACGVRRVCTWHLYSRVDSRVSSFWHCTPLSALETRGYVSYSSGASSGTSLYR